MQSFKQWLEDISQAGIMGDDYASPAIQAAGGSPGGFDQYGQRWELPRKRKRKPKPLGDIDGSHPPPIKTPQQDTMTNRLP